MTKKMQILLLAVSLVVSSCTPIVFYRALNTTRTQQSQLVFESNSFLQNLSYDSNLRIASSTQVPSGRTWSYQLKENALPAIGLSCTTESVPNGVALSVVDHRIHIDLGPQLSAGTASWSCETSSSSFDLDIGYLASPIALASSMNLAETTQILGNNASSMKISQDGTAAIFMESNQVYHYHFATDKTTLISSGDGSILNQGNGVTASPSISGDGLKVVFASTSTNLISGITGGVYQVYLKDLSTNELSLVSSLDGSVSTRGDLGATTPQISEDGSNVVFQSSSTNFVSGASGSQIYMKNLNTGSIRLVSSLDGTSATMAVGLTTSAQLSLDGSSVVFRSNTSNLVSGSSGFQIFHKNMTTETVTLVSSTDGTSGNQGNSTSSSPSLSRDGSKVLFQSISTNLISGSSGNQLYLKDLNSGLLTLVSSTDGTGGNQANSGASLGSISSDGTQVVFISSSSNLVSGASGAQVYFKNLNTGLISLASSLDGTAPTQGNASSTGTHLNSDGSKILFSSSSNNLVSNSTGSQIFLKDNSSGAVSIISKSQGHSAIAANSTSDQAQISSDGTKILFSSVARNLLGSTTNGYSQIFLKNTQTGVTTLVSSVDGTVSTQGNNNSYRPTMTSDGLKIVFESQSTNLVSGSSGRQLFLKDLQTGALSLISSLDGTASQQSNHTSNWYPKITKDGTKVVFESCATNFVSGTSGTVCQIYLKNLASGAITLVSSLDGTGATEANNHCYYPDISQDGSRVVFSSYTSNLFPGITPWSHVYMKDLNTGIMHLVTSTDGTILGQANHNSSRARISEDGNLVHMSSSSTNLVTGTNGLNQILVKNMTNGAFTLISSLDGTPAGQANAASYYGQMSADGTMFVFTSSATNLVSGASGTQVYLKNLNIGQITLLSSVDGTASTQSNGASDYAQISADGTRAVFETTATNLVFGATSGIKQVIYRQLQ